MDFSRFLCNCLSCSLTAAMFLIFLNEGLNSQICDPLVKHPPLKRQGYFVERQTPNARSYKIGI